MRNKTAILSSLAIIATLFTTAQGALADNAGTEQLVSTVTNYDDGITMSEFKNSKGFKVEGGGAIFTYNADTKLMTCSNVNGAPAVFDFSK